MLSGCATMTLGYLLCQRDIQERSHRPSCKLLTSNWVLDLIRFGAHIATLADRTPSRPLKRDNNDWTAWMTGHPLLSRLRILLQMLISIGLQMLKQTQVPSFLWTYCCNHANAMICEGPKAADCQTPNFKWDGTPFDISVHRVFGYRVHSRQPPTRYP
jgi:hypothetical protein